MTHLSMEHQRLFETLAPYIRALPDQQRLQRSDLLTPEFRLYDNAHLAVFYAPFDYVNPAAQVMLIGITPGWAQARLSLRTPGTARRARS